MMKSNRTMFFLNRKPVFPICVPATVVQILNNIGVKYNFVNVLDSDKLREG